MTASHETIRRCTGRFPCAADPLMEAACMRSVIVNRRNSRAELRRTLLTEIGIPSEGISS
jgi:hypothetical protein